MSVEYNLTLCIKMRSEHLTSYKTPKASRGVTDRLLISQSINDWNSIETRSNAKALSITKSIQIGSESASENVFVPSPNLKVHKSSPRFFMNHQKSPERIPPTSRITYDSHLQKWSSINISQGVPKNLYILDKIHTCDKEIHKEDEGIIPAPKLIPAISKRASKIPTNDNSCLKESVLHLPNENQPAYTTPIKQDPIRASNEEKKTPKPSIKVCTETLIKSFSPRAVRDSYLRNVAKPYEAVFSCRNITSQQTGVSENIDNRRELRSNLSSLPKKAMEELLSQKTPLAKPNQMLIVRDVNVDSKNMKASENPKYLKRIDQVKRMKEAKGAGGEENKQNVMSKTFMKNKAETSLHKRSGYGDLMNTNARKPDWSSIAVKKIEITLEDESPAIALKTRYVEFLADIRIFSEVLDFLCMSSLCQISRTTKRFRSSKHMSLIKKAQCQLIINGLNREDQYSFWDFQINFSFLQKSYPLQYMINVSKPSNFEKDILNDIDRTNNLPRSQQNSLLKILIAFSNNLPKIGYIQGLNSIVAVFLSQKLTEPEIFWILKFIFQKKRIAEIYTEGFSKVQLLTYQLEIYIRNYLPKLIDHLGENGMNVSYFAIQWFITMFSYDLELTQLIKLWNLFFIKGWKVIIRIALSILWHFQDDICSKSSDDLPSFLKTFVIERIGTVPEKDLFEVALSFKVSNRLLNYLETLYEHSAPVNVILVSSAENKLQWKILPDDCTPRNISTLVPKDLMEYLNENIEQMRSMNKMKGDVCNQLDNYRSVALDRVNTSITLDSISLDYRSSGKSQILPQTIKPSDQTFIQTLSSLGRKLKQILTPKSNSQTTFYSQYKAPYSDSPELPNEKEGCENLPTEQNEHRSNYSLSRKNCKLLVSTSIMGAVPFKKSIVGALKDSNTSLGINLFNPMNFSMQRKRETSRRSGYRSIVTVSSTKTLVNQTERKGYSIEDNQRYKHKRNSSFNQEALSSLYEIKPPHQNHQIQEKREKHDISPSNQDGYITPTSCKTETDCEVDKSTESNSRKRPSLFTKNLYLAGGYYKKGKTDEKAKGPNSIGRAGLTWGEYQKIYTGIESPSYQGMAFLRENKAKSGLNQLCSIVKQGGKLDYLN